MTTWSPSALKNAASCSLALFYDKRMKLKPTQTAKLAAGDFIHGFIEHFYKEDGTPAYKDAEAFANAAYGGWFNYIEHHEIKGEPISWQDKGERFVFAQKLKKACSLLYSRYSVEPPPLLIEHEYKFEYNGRVYSGKIDEIRQGHIIRDHKNKEFGEEKPWTIPQLTAEVQPKAYALAYSLSACYFGWFRDKIKLSDEERREIERDELSLVEKVIFEYQFLQSGRIVPIKVSRRDIRDLELLIDESELKLQNNVVAPNRKSCFFCLYRDKCGDYIDIAQHPSISRVRQLKFFEPDPRTNLVKNFIIGKVARKKTKLRQFSLKFK